MSNLDQAPPLNDFEIANSEFIDVSDLRDVSSKSRTLIPRTMPIDPNDRNTIKHTMIP
jgi:hypothetical protein